MPWNVGMTWKSRNKSYYYIILFLSLLYYAVRALYIYIIYYTRVYNYMYLIVGWGLSGATVAERIANCLNERVIIIDKRPHIGGNCYDYIEENTNIRINKYGAHLFHTNNKQVWDIHDDLSFPLPVIIICEILGIPTNDIKRFKGWADAAVAQMCSEEPETYQKELDKMDDYFLTLINKKRSMPEDDSLISRIANSKINNEYLSDDEAVRLLAQIFVAGNETTTSLISNLVWRLLSIDNLWNDFVADKLQIDGLISESLRFDPPLLGLFKTTSKDVTYDDVTIPSNTKVMMHYGAANRDNEIFDNPNKFDSTRDGKKVISFSVGIHICLGRELAKLETRVALRALKKRFPNLKLINNGQRVGPFLFWGRSNLPVSHN